MDNNEKSNAAFEAWAASCNLRFGKDVAWAAWEAAWNRRPAPQAAPEGWYQRLNELRNNTETFGPYSQETARVAIECCMNALEELETEHAATSPAPAVVQMTDEHLSILKKLTDDAEIFLAGGVVGLRQSIDKARAILSASGVRHE